MKLFGTLPSPFTRKVRAVLLQNKIDFELVPITNLMLTGSEHFAGNPLQMFPVLEDGETWLVESDVICQYLLNRYGRGTKDPLWFDYSRNANEINILSICSGIVEAGVHVLRARRSGIENPGQYAFFAQELNAIPAGLAWLEQNPWVMENANGFNDLDYLSLNLVCALDWLQFREFVSDFGPYPNLDRFAKTRASLPALAATRPE